MGCLQLPNQGEVCQPSLFQRSFSLARVGFNEATIYPKNHQAGDGLSPARGLETLGVGRLSKNPPHSESLLVLGATGKQKVVQSLY